MVQADVCGNCRKPIWRWEPAPDYPVTDFHDWAHGEPPTARADGSYGPYPIPEKECHFFARPMTLADVM